MIQIDLIIQNSQLIKQAYSFSKKGEKAAKVKGLLQGI